MCCAVCVCGNVNAQSVESNLIMINLIEKKRKEREREKFTKVTSMMITTTNYEHRKQTLPEYSGSELESFFQNFAKKTWNNSTFVF